MSELESLKRAELKDGTPSVNLVETDAGGSPAPLDCLSRTSGSVDRVDGGARPDESMHVAMSVPKYYWIRFSNFAIDFVLTAFSYILLLMCVVLITCKGNIFSVPIHWSLCFIWPVVVFVALKSYRGVRGYSETRMLVVDGRGERITPRRALARALALSLTWFLFPVHLVLMATGSRQLLHDSLSGCFVVTPGENPERSIYPPAPKWIAVLLVAGCMWCVFSIEQVGSQWERMELGAVQILLGPDNPLYASYLESKCNMSPLEITELSQSKAANLLPRFESLANLQIGIKSPSRRQSEGILKIYKAALVAARADKPQVAAHYLMILGELPGIGIERALGERWIDVLEFDTSPNIRAANLLRKVGHRDEAIALANAEKESAKKAGDSDRLRESTRLIDLATTQEPDYDPFAPVDTYDSSEANMRAFRIKLRELDDAGQ